MISPGCRLGLSRLQKVTEGYWTSPLAAGRVMISAPLLPSRATGTADGPGRQDRARLRPPSYIEIFPVVRPVAYSGSSISPLPVGRRCRFFTVCG